ncbi:MAG: hypothetical protein LQ342_008581, partial [Letrouitia transgressa]
KVITNLENIEEPEQTARTDQGYNRKGKQEENQKESKKVKKEKVKRELKRIKKEELQTPVTNFLLILLLCLHLHVPIVRGAISKM